jgi:hypothetical protein
MIFFSRHDVHDRDEAYPSTSNNDSSGFVQEMKRGVETLRIRIAKKWLKVE